MGHGTGDNRIVAIRKGGFKRTATQEHDGCNHTSTNAPDPIRTPQLSVLWARVLLGWVTSWKVLVLHPPFWLLRVLFRLATCRPNGFGPSHRHRRRAIIDPSIRWQDTGRRNRAYEISPRFLRNGRSHRSRTIDRNGKLFGCSRGMERAIIGL